MGKNVSINFGGEGDTSLYMEPSEAIRYFKGLVVSYMTAIDEINTELGYINSNIADLIDYYNNGINAISNEYENSNSYLGVVNTELSYLNSNIADLINYYSNGINAISNEYENSNSYLTYINTNIDKLESYTQSYIGSLQSTIIGWSHMYEYVIDNCIMNKDKIYSITENNITTEYQEISRVNYGSTEGETFTLNVSMNNNAPEELEITSYLYNTYVVLRSIGLENEDIICIPIYNLVTDGETENIVYSQNENVNYPMFEQTERRVIISLNEQNSENNTSNNGSVSPANQGDPVSHDDPQNSGIHNP